MGKIWSRIKGSKQESTKETGYLSPPLNIYLTYNGLVYADGEEVAKQEPNSKVLVYQLQGHADTYQHCGLIFSTGAAT